MPVMTKTPKGEDIVILSRKEYETLVASVSDDAADAEALRRSIGRVKSGEDHTLTSAEIDELLASKTPLAFYRKKHGLTQAALAQRIGIAQGFLSEIEAGFKAGDIRTLRKIADELRISLDDLVPQRKQNRSRASGKAYAVGYEAKYDQSKPVRPGPAARFKRMQKKLRSPDKK